MEEIAIKSFNNYVSSDTATKINMQYTSKPNIVKLTNEADLV